VTPEQLERLTSVGRRKSTFVLQLARPLLVKSGIRGDWLQVVVVVDVVAVAVVADVVADSQARNQH